MSGGGASWASQYPLTAKFLRAVEYTLRNEGLDRVTNYAVDRGGLTKWGITRGALERHQEKHGRLLDKRVPDLTREDALSIYRADYWRFEQIPDARLATKLFDIYVPLSPRSAALVYQKALNAIGFPVDIDGVLGNETMAALVSAPPELLLDVRPEPGRPDADCPGALIAALAQHHITDVKGNPPQIAFLAGWLARAWRIPS